MKLRRIEYRTEDNASLGLTLRALQMTEDYLDHSFVPIAAKVQIRRQKFKFAAEFAGVRNLLE